MAIRRPEAWSGEAAEKACRSFLDTLATRFTLLAAKAYRVSLDGVDLPIVPCLDHEAQLTGRVPAHVSAYVRDQEGDLHEVGCVPAEQRVTLDTASTWAETEEPARLRMRQQLTALFPDDTVEEKRPSVLRGDLLVARVVRAQLRLGEVLSGNDGASVKWKLERLKAIADLMEKESRVSSWTVRTLTPLVLGAAGVSLWWVLELFHAWLSPAGVETLRYAALTALGSSFLWVGLKAVHLTEMGTRVWKRATEYRLILDARERLEKERAAGPRKASA